MRKLLFSLFMMLSAFASNAMAQSELTLTFPLKDQVSINAYNKTWTGKDANGAEWRFVSFNNNSNGWAYIRCGWKTDVTTSVISSPLIEEAVLTYAIKVDKTSGVTSAKLEVLQSDSTTVVESKDVTMKAGTVTVELTGTKNAYYRLTIENSKVSSNGTTQISALTLTKETTGPTYTFNATGKDGKEVKAKFASSPLTVKFADYEDGMTFKVNGADATYNAETGLSITAKAGSKANDQYVVAVYASNGDSLTSKTYTWIPTATSVSTLKSYADGTEAILSSTAAKVTYVDATQKNVYIQDATRGILAYDLGLSGFEAYKQTNVKIWGKKTTYKTGVVEFVACDSTATSTVTPSATVVTPTAKTVAQTLLADNQLTYVKITGAKIVKENTNYYAVAGSDSVMLYDSFKTGRLTEIDTVQTCPCFGDITGIISIYNGTVQVLPIVIDNVGDKITGTCGTVTYTIDMDGNMVFAPTEGETGTLAALGIADSKRPWSGVVSSVKTVKFETGVATASDPSYMFKGMANLETVDFTNLNTSAATTVKGLFQNCASLKAVDFSALNLSAVKNFTQVFDGCKALAKIDMRYVSTALVTKIGNAANMFATGCMPDTLILSKNFGKCIDGSYVALPAKKFMALDEAGNRVEGKNFEMPADLADLYTYNEGLANYGTYVTYAEATAITNVMATGIKSGKAIKNGRIVIIKNGKQYNAAGQVIINNTSFASF